MAVAKKTTAAAKKTEEKTVKTLAEELAREDKPQTAEKKAAPAAKKTTTAVAKKPTAKKTTTTAAAKKPAAKKTTTTATKKVDHTAIIEFAGNQFNVDDVVAKAEADFKANNKRKTFSDLKVYIKPEENKAYYVVKTGKSESAGSVEL